VNIVVNPDLGEIDDSELIKTLVCELKKGSDAQQMMTEVWAQTDTLRVIRKKPLTTSSGKLLPLYIHKQR
jgi:hypothetical protein